MVKSGRRDGRAARRAAGAVRAGGDGSARKLRLWGRAALPGALVFLVAVLAMAPAAEAPFSFDDASAIERNAGIRRLANVPEFFAPDYWKPREKLKRGVYRPVREAAFALAWAVAGRDARFFHGVNIVLHGLCAVLVLALARAVLSCGRAVVRQRTVPAHGTSARYGSGVAALAAGMLFAVHPAHAEAVAFTKNLGELLATLLALAAALAFVRGLAACKEDAPQRARAACLPRSRQGGWGWTAASAALFAASLLTKETAAPLPFLLCLAVPVVCRRERRRSGLLRTAPHWALAVVYIALQAAAMSQGGGAPPITELGGRGPRMDGAQRLGLVGYTVMKYAQLGFAPAGMTAWHSVDWPRATAPAWAAAAGLAGAAVAALYVLRPRAGLGPAWFLAALGPAANLVVNADRAIAEQRLYLPSVGICLAIGAALGACLPRRRQAATGGLPAATAAQAGRAGRRAGWVRALAAVLVAGWGAQCFDRCGAWGDHVKLWSDVVRRSPGLGPAQANLARAYLEGGSSAVPSPARMRAAMAASSRALALRPKDHVARIDRAMVTLMAGDLAGAKAEVERGLGLDPGNAELWNALGFLRVQEGPRGLPEAEACFRRAIERDPALDRAYGNLAGVLARRGDWGAARDCLRRALELAPDEGGWHTAYAEACLGPGGGDASLRAEALDHAQRGMELAPGNPRAWQVLGLARRANGDEEGAQRAFRRAGGL